MKLYHLAGEVFTGDFDAIALYDLARGAKRTKAAVIIPVTSQMGFRMQIRLSEIDVSRSLEEAIIENHPPMND